MDNLKYYNDSFAYDYTIFAPAEKKRAEIHKYPGESVKKNAARHAATVERTRLIRNLIVSAMVVAAVCSSLFLRAEISSIKRDINSVDKQIAEYESEAVRLSVEMERKISVSNLEEAAIELGMQKCEKSQITYIITNGNDTAENSKGDLTVGLNRD